MNILVLEDNEDNRRLIVKRLSRLGHQVDEAATVAAARSALENSCPDVLLLDIHLHDGDGLEALSQWRGTLNLPPVIVCSAMAYPEDRVRAEKAGCVGYLTKPINLRTLVQDIEELLRAAQA